MTKLIKLRDLTFESSSAPLEKTPRNFDVHKDETKN